MQSYKEDIESFKRYLYENERSQSTISKYVHDVYEFRKWLGAKELSKQEMMLYKQELCKAYKPRSVNSILSSLNSWFSYIGRAEVKVKLLKIQQQLYADRARELTRQEYNMLLQAAQRNNDRRMYCLMQTLGSTGIRVSEAVYCKGG